jgi:hypothetical protein
LLKIFAPHLPPEARRVFVGIQSAISYYLERALLEEEKAGRIKKVPLHLAFNSWAGILHYYLANHDLFEPKGSVLKKHGKALLDHYLNLLKKTENQP